MKNVRTLLALLLLLSATHVHVIKAEKAEDDWMSAVLNDSTVDESGEELTDDTSAAESDYYYEEGDYYYGDESDALGVAEEVYPAQEVATPKSTTKKSVKKPAGKPKHGRARRRMRIRATNKARKVRARRARQAKNKKAQTKAATQPASGKK